MKPNLSGKSAALLSLIAVSLLLGNATLAQSPQTSYPVRVMNAISQQPKPALDVDGRVLIVFEIRNDGSLRSVSVAKSSGSDILDETAKAIIRAAAPFPEPPRGAQKVFSIEIRTAKPQQPPPGPALTTQDR